jgi:hypothetical protein
MHLLPILVLPWRRSGIPAQPSVGAPPGEQREGAIFAEVSVKCRCPRHARGLLARAALVALGAVAAFATTAAAESESLEYAVKATFLYKFAPFVEWPPMVFSSATAPLVVCVVGKDPFGPLLDQAIAGQKMGDRPVVIHRMDTASRDAGCHIMFIGGSPGQSADDALNVMRGAPVLTVTDSGQSAQGMISFVIDNARVRFDIDDDAASRAGIMVSSKLLSLAHRVKRAS